MRDDGGKVSSTQREFSRVEKQMEREEHTAGDLFLNRPHQKRNYFFARPNPMKSQRTDACGCDRHDIFPGGAFGATRCGRRVDSGAFSAAQFSPQAEIFQL